MHREATHFIEWVKKNFPFAFFYRNVLDVGGGDINGNNKNLFTWDDKETYTCNDIGNAPNATTQCPTKDLPFPPQHFDTIISTECFEHDAEYEESIKKIVYLLKDGGLFLFTCATTGRPEHGTRRTSPDQSWATINDNSTFRDYYKNITIEDVQKVVNLDDVFYKWSSYKVRCDLYFVGIKRGGKLTHNIPPYYPGKSIGRVTGIQKLTGHENMLCLQNHNFNITEPCMVKYGYGGLWYRRFFGVGNYKACDELFWLGVGGKDPVDRHHKQCKKTKTGTRICVLSLAPEYASYMGEDIYAADSKKNIEEMCQNTKRWKARIYGWRKIRKTMPVKHAQYFVRATDSIFFGENNICGDTIWIGTGNAPERVKNNTILYKWGQALTMLSDDYDYILFNTCGCFVNISKLEEKIISYRVPSYGVFTTPFNLAAEWFTLTSIDVAFNIYRTLHFDLSNFSKAYLNRDATLSHAADHVMSVVANSFVSYTSLPGSVKDKFQHVGERWAVRLDNGWNTMSADLNNDNVRSLIDTCNLSNLIVVRWKPVALPNNEMYDNVDYVIDKLLTQTIKKISRFESNQRWGKKSELIGLKIN